MKIYYKVLSASLRSAIVSGRYNLQYKVNEWTEPVEGTRLFIFRSLYDARDFFRNNAHVGANSIYECHAEGVSTPHFRANCVTSFSIETFWKYFGRKMPNYYKQTVPTGTLWAKKVKLLNQVY